jgi:hypothetical protein
MVAGMDEDSTSTKAMPSCDSSKALLCAAHLLLLLPTKSTWIEHQGTCTPCAPSFCLQTRQTLQ